MILDLKNITKSFGGLTAVNNVSFQVGFGEVVVIIGPNGAGKTTLFNLITGITVPDEGSISFLGKEIHGLASDRIASMGMTRTFQNLQIFHNMNCLENVMVGAHLHGKKNLLQVGLRFPGVAAEERLIRDKAMEILESVGLANKALLPAGILPYGEQRLLEIARALAMEPKLILLDEPAAGLNSQETGELSKLISLLTKKGMSVILVEHDMEMVMEVADRIVVLDYGSKIAEGTPEEVQNNPLVIAAYLGEEVDEDALGGRT